MDPEVLAELERLAGRSAAAGDAFDTLTSGIRDGLPNWQRANGSVRGFGLGVQEAEKKVKSAFDKFKSGLGSSLSEIKSGFKSVGNESESGAKAIKNITDSLGSAVSGFAGQFGIIGQGLGGLVSLITGMTGVALGFVDELTTTNKKLNEAGIAFGIGSGIDEFDKIIKDNAISAGMLNTVIENSTNSLRLFSGGAANGLRIVAKGFTQLKNANNGQYESLVKLGYSTEEMMEGMADFGATARLAGQNLNMDQLVEGTTKYLTLQRELTRLTGTSVKEAKAREEALKADLAFQRMLREVGAENGEVLKKVMASIPDSLAPIAKTLITGGTITDQQMALLANALGEDVNFLTQLGEDARNIKLDPEQVAKDFAGFQSRLAKNVENYVDQYGAGFIQTILQTNGPLAELFKTLGLVTLELEPGEAAAETLVDTTTNVAKGMGDIAKALPEIEKASIALRSALYTTGSTLTAVFAPLITGLAGTIEGGASALQESLNKITSGYDKANAIMAQEVGRGPHFDYATVEARQEAANQAIAESIGTIGDNTMFEGLFNKLGDTISTAISNGFTQAIAEINPFRLSEREATEFETTDEFSKIKKIIESMEPGERMQTGAGADFDKFTQVLQYLDAFDPETRAKKMQELGLTEEKQLTDKFNDWFFSLFGSESDSKTLVKPPGKAYGDIMNPKPGGHIVKVAEAGQPEVIAPASRGPNGKLGLEVSGAMLDNSRLLQSLLKVNEGQAAMMAGLNDKMSNMSGHMENLVSAQRQANRLAV